MSDNITVTGLVGTEPRNLTTNGGLDITSFRLVSHSRYFDRAKGSWEDGNANWFTVTGFRNLAINSSRSLKKGDHVVVQGRLRLRQWESGEKNGTSVEIEADAIGHDLSWCITSAERSRPITSAGDTKTGGGVETQWAGPGALGVVDAEARDAIKSTQRTTSAA